ncbi:hypothetical protein LCGC14_0641540 [marine sediment metagenome]|uniref:Rad52/22 double-strand break repair protein n=1 Tax=marine sediment metagenome TaxID=412755 RepID=A0A0F9R478_9ZZZZ|nr:hypothetical protein [archaeon]
MAKKPQRQTSRAIIIRPVKLAARQRKTIAIRTPLEFIKQRKGKGGKTFRYVEGGYVVARLNEIFSPIGWDFSIIDERVEKNEVVVRGKLMIKDYKHGYSVSKTQYGTKIRNTGVPLGDTLKAAATDCLKKCASLFGIALDVYWPDLDRASKGNGDEIVIGKTKPTTKRIKTKDLVEFTMNKIKNEENGDILYRMMLNIRKQKAGKLLSQTAKDKLIKAIMDKLGMKNEEL